MSTYAWTSGRPAVDVDRRRAAMDQNSVGHGFGRSGLHDPARDAIALRVPVAPRNEGPARRRDVGWLKDRSSRPTSSTSPGCSPRWRRYQTLPFGRTRAPVRLPGLDRERRDLAGFQVVTGGGRWRPSRSSNRSSARRVGPPIGDLGQPIPRERQVGDLARLDVPDSGRPLAAALVADGEARIARDRRPAERAQRSTLVVEVRLHLPVRASRMRSDGWMRSPCSACSIASSVSSAESAPWSGPGPSCSRRRGGCDSMLVASVAPAHRPRRRTRRIRRDR